MLVFALTVPLRTAAPPSCLQVFDVRMTPRMLCSVPFAPGPSLLRFHPRFNSTMLLASAGGAFTMADAQGMSGALPAAGEGSGHPAESTSAHATCLVCASFAQHLGSRAFASDRAATRGTGAIRSATVSHPAIHLATQPAQSLS